VVSIIRLISLVQFAASTNPTWDNLNVTIWSSVESNVGIICVCMPNLQILLVRVFPKVLRSTRNDTTNKYYAQGSRNRMGTNVSVGRSKDLPVPPKYSKTIMYSQSYEVDLEDETHLVSMVDLPPVIILFLYSSSSLPFIYTLFRLPNKFHLFPDDSVPNPQMKTSTNSL
jgi:hypothetical protein